MKDITKI